MANYFGVVLLSRPALNLLTLRPAPARDEVREAAEATEALSSSSGGLLVGSGEPVSVGRTVMVGRPEVGGSVIVLL